MEPIVTNIPNIETVRWAYRLVLGREPENEAVLAHWAALGDGRLILAYFVRSPEAQAHRAAGAPAHGGWAIAPLNAAAIRATFHMRFNAIPSAKEIAAEIKAHGDLASFRRAFLGSAEVSGLAAKPAAAPPASPAPAPLVSRTEEHGFTVLGSRFSVRGDGPEGYWRDLVEQTGDPSLERLTRLVRAAFPDGGAGRVLADAGANIGVTGLTMAAAAPYHAELLCFEPDERSLPLLRHNLAANEFGRAQVFDCALAERDGTARLRCGATNAATSVLAEAHSRTQSVGAIFKDVPVRQLDSVLAEIGVGRLDLLKIDVEGGETSVMLGAMQAIARDAPIIFTEFNLWTQMTAGARNPLEVLEEWRASFRHMVAFDAEGRPFPVLDQDGLLWILHTVMMERGCVDDLILCDRLDWLERWN
ncbi:MAG: FkbM family methyltransferase [Roseococcus sp.]